MGFLKCPQCAKQLSDQAQFCPHCGHPFATAPQYPMRSRGWEWRSQAELWGYPLVHIAIGWNPKTKKLHVAKGIIAIGQFAIGLITIAQFGVGLCFGLGQFVAAPIVIAQFALGLFGALGQFAVGYLAMGQVAVGHYAYGSKCLGTFVHSKTQIDPEAKVFFAHLFQYIRSIF